jgi:hypothetical protein
MVYLSLILVIIFFILSIIHFNWVRGGTWGFDNALPTNENGERILNPRKIDSLIVGLGLLGFSFFYLHLSDLLKIPILELISNYIKWIIPSIFLLRAIGDFRYMGLFKKVKNTAFGRFDTFYFTPLCIIVCMLGFIVSYQ